jgi:predicted amidohydrolase YtcJ
MRNFRHNRLVILLLLSMILACAPWAISPTPTDAPAPAPTTTRMEPAHSPDAILHNGIVLTMNEFQPQAQAIAIEGGRILAVGSNAEILALRDPSTRVIDLQGKTILPGFIDSHQHRIGDRVLGGHEKPEPILQLAVEEGWTSLNELFVNEQRLNELRSLDEAGKLRLRINAYLALQSPEGDPYGNWYQAYQAGFEYSPTLRLIGVKLFMDHGWGSGKLLWSQAELDQMVLEAHRLNWQIAIHTLGEPAHTMALNALEKAQGGVADERYRHRIEHVVVISDADIQRMERLGIVASIQFQGPGTWVEYPDFAPEVSPDMYPHFARWRDLVEAGVLIVGGSDWPWGILEHGFGSPMLLLYQAVTRTGTNRRPPEAWMLGQALTMEQALRSLTINGAYATFEEDRKGSLETGKLADIVILSENPLTSPIEEVPDIQVLMTMIGGAVEYCALGQESLCPGIQATIGGPSPVAESPLSAPFTGTWQGTDPFDSSIITLSLE